MTRRLESGRELLVMSIALDAERHRLGLADRIGDQAAATVERGKALFY
jgi:hypothetical protein